MHDVFLRAAGRAGRRGHACVFESYKRDHHSAAVHLQGGLLTVKNVSLPKATFVKFQPQHVDFLQISNPRAVLERQLRHFSCVTVGDQICIPYNDRRYYLEVREVKPQEAACIIECDCNVDFDAPVGYVDPSVVRLAARPRVAPRLCACARTRVLCRAVLIESANRNITRRRRGQLRLRRRRPQRLRSQCLRRSLRRRRK